MQLKHLCLHPFPGTDAQVEPVPFPPAADTTVSAGDGILEGLLNVTGLKFDAQTAILPPLEDMVVSVLGWSNKDLIVKDHLRPLKTEPEVEDVDVAMRTCDSGNTFSVAVGDA